MWSPSLKKMAEVSASLAIAYLKEAYSWMLTFDGGLQARYQHLCEIWEGFTGHLSLEEQREYLGFLKEEARKKASALTPSQRSLFYHSLALAALGVHPELAEEFASLAFGGGMPQRG